MRIDEAEEILRMVCGGDLNLQFTGHFWDRVRERTPGFTKQHVYQVLRKGTIHGAPEVDVEYGNYKVRVRATVVDFGKVEIILGILWLGDSVCVTIYEKK